MRSRGVMKERGWRLPNDRLGSGDDITVFVIPLAGAESETWQGRSRPLWWANQDTALICAGWGRGAIAKKNPFSFELKGKTYALLLFLRLFRGIISTLASSYQPWDDIIIKWHSSHSPFLTGLLWKTSEHTKPLWYIYSGSLFGSEQWYKERERD